MSKWKAYVTRGFPGDGMTRLKEEFDVVQTTGWFFPSKEELKEKIADADVLLTYSDNIDAEILAAAPKLKYIADNWGGRRNIDEKVCAERGIEIYDGKGMPNNYAWIVKGVAEIAWGLIIATGRRFHEGDELVRHGSWTHSEQSNHVLLGEGMFGRRLGILGCGRIGTLVAKRSVGFEMDVVYSDVKENEEVNALGAKRVSMDELFETSDFIVICVSAMDDTNTHIVGEKQFKQMKKNARLINVTRGFIIDEKAMIKALKEGEFAAAGLEVFETEPNVSEELKAMPNVTLMPHAGGALFNERAKNFDIMVDSAIAFKKEYEAKK